MTFARLLGAASVLAAGSAAFLMAQSGTVSVQQAISTAEIQAARNKIDISRYYLTAVQRASRLAKTASMPGENAQEYYELWWARPNDRRGDYIGMAVTRTGTTWRIASTESMRKSPRTTGSPRVPLKDALRLVEGYGLRESLITPGHYLHSASLVFRDRSPDETYWFVSMRNQNGMEEDNVQFAVRMDGSVYQLGMM